MNNYDFQDLNDFYIDKVWIPSSAMFYDGILLEDKIEGYQTLSVNGREMLSLDVQTDSVLNGVLINSQRLNSRTLTIKYKLDCKTAEEVQEKYKLLMQLLYREKNIEIKFYDEAEWNYYGRYISSDEVDGSSNSIVSSFSILCESPFKYTKEHASKGQIASQDYFRLIPTRFTVVTNQVNEISVTNGKETIKISGKPFNKGDILVFDFLQGIVFLNGENQTKLLDLTSDFKNFTLKNKDSVTCTGGTLEMNYKGVSL